METIWIHILLLITKRTRVFWGKSLFCFGSCRSVWISKWSDLLLDIPGQNHHRGPPLSQRRNVYFFFPSYHAGTYSYVALEVWYCMYCGGRWFELFSRWVLVTTGSTLTLSHLMYLTYFTRFWPWRSWTRRRQIHTFPCPDRQVMGKTDIAEKYPWVFVQKPQTRAKA